MEQRETACPIGILGQSGSETRLAGESRLLVSSHSGDRNLSAEMLRHRDPHDAARRADRWQHCARHIENAQQVVVPISLFQIHKHCSRCVGHIGAMTCAMGEIPDKPRIHGAEQ